MKELTKKQREPLFEIVRHYQQDDLDLTGYKAIPVQGNIIIKQVVANPPNDSPAITRVRIETVELWDRYGYISSKKYQEKYLGPVTTFVLNEDALKYENLMQKPRFIRFLMITWEKLIADTPSLIWGIIGGVIGGVLTAIILYFLGLAPP